MKQIYTTKYIFITPMTWPHPRVFIAPFVTTRLWKTVSVLAKHNIYRRQSSFIWSQKVWNNRSELRSKKMENTSSLQLRAFSPICVLSLIAIKGRRMLNGPSAHVCWSMVGMGSRQVCGSVKHQHVPLPPIIPTNVPWSLDYSMMASLTYSVSVPLFTSLTGTGKRVIFPFFMP